MTSREKLHRLVDELSDAEVEAALVRLTRDHKTLGAWAETDDRYMVEAVWSRENARKAIREEPWYSRVGDVPRHAREVMGCRYAWIMATTPKVGVDLDAKLVADTREALGAQPEDPDSAAVERALNDYLLLRLIDRVQTRSGLSEEEANEIAYEELRAMRRERGSAA